MIQFWLSGTPLRFDRLRCLALFACLLMLAVGAHADEKEQTLKLALAMKVAKYVQGNLGSQPQYTIAVTSGALTDSLGTLLKDRTIHQHPVKIQYLNSPAEVNSQQVLILPPMGADALSAWLQTASQQHILTISDMRGFVDRGGMVQLRKESRKFRLKINLDAVHAAGLKIRSRLLKIAEVISGGQV